MDSRLPYSLSAILLIVAGAGLVTMLNEDFRSTSTEISLVEKAGEEIKKGDKEHSAGENLPAVGAKEVEAPSKPLDLNPINSMAADKEAEELLEEPKVLSEQPEETLAVDTAEPREQEMTAGSTPETSPEINEEALPEEKATPDSPSIFKEHDVQIKPLELKGFSAPSFRYEAPKEDHISSSEKTKKNKEEKGVEKTRKADGEQPEQETQP